MRQAADTTGLSPRRERLALNAAPAPRPAPQPAQGAQHDLAALEQRLEREVAAWMQRRHGRP